MKTETPAEFPSDWHYQRHLEDLERELAGRLRRLEELKALSTLPEVLAQAEAEVAAVRDRLEAYGVKQTAAAKRPATKGKTR